MTVRRNYLAVLITIIVSLCIVTAYVLLFVPKEDFFPSRDLTLGGITNEEVM